MKLRKHKQQKLKHKNKRNGIGSEIGRSKKKKWRRIEPYILEYQLNQTNERNSENTNTKY